ncbi:MAG TPA: mitochondrial fission ELM1 family protein [Rhodanobacteraceae bacterium]
MPSSRPMETISECWVITNGAAGNERQALALAGCLPWPVRNLTLTPRAPWAWVAPRLLPGAQLVDPAHALHPPWPTVVIGCGRGAAFFTRLVQRQSGGTSRSVQILDPRINPRHWDLVIAPEHDRLHGANVLVPLGSLNPVDDTWLAAGRAAWAQLANLPAPRLGVLLGGPRHGIVFDSVYAKALGQAIRARHQRDGGSVLMTASRRTSTDLFDTLATDLADIPGIRWSTSADGPNPYPGILGWADRLIVTPDSVNMLSEACACGCAVHTLATPGLPDKLARFHAGLRTRGLLHAIDATVPARQTPLRETRVLAEQVCQRLGLPGFRENSVYPR